MRRLLMGAALAAVMAAVLPAGSARAEQSLGDAFAAAFASMDEGRCDAAALQGLVKRPDFAAAPSAARSLTYASLAICDRKADWSDLAARATAEPDSVALAWSLRFAHAADEGRMTEAVAALHNAVDRKDDGTFTVFNDELVYTVGRRLNDDDAEFSRFAAALMRADWKADSPFYGGDWIWAKYAELLIEAGDEAAAARAVARVVEPSELLRMRLDRRFDAIVAADPAKFEPAPAMQKLLARDRVTLAGRPQDGMGLTDVVARMRILGLQAEALDLVETALARRQRIVDDKGHDHRNWLLNDRALLLMELGRHDEALKVMEQAARHDERREGRGVGGGTHAGPADPVRRADRRLLGTAAFRRGPC